MTGDEYAQQLEAAKKLCTCETKKIFNINEDNSSYIVDTATKNIGNFIVSYTVTDHGIKCGNVTLDPITMQYDRTYVINYNYCPLLEVHNLAEFWDTSITSLSEYILSGQGAQDSEDTQNNVPWWKAYKDTKNLLFDSNNENTQVKMNYDNLRITGITDIEFNAAFEYDTDYNGNYLNKETIKTFKDTWLSPEASNKGAFENDNGVYNKNLWVDAMYEDAVANGLWQYISSVEVTVDTHDQWGKYASDRVSGKGKAKGVETNPQITPGLDPDNPNEEETKVNPEPNDPDNPYDNPSTYQTPDERKVTLIIINPELDVDVTGSRIIENVRYINESYINTLQNTDWNNKESVNKLLRMFALQKMQNSSNWEDVIAPIQMEYQNKIGNTITVNVYDYGIYTETEEAWQQFLNDYGLTEPSGYERQLE
jgi:hypothetical protein